jgi:hypothetical protein
MPARKFCWFNPLGTEFAERVLTDFSMRGLRYLRDPEPAKDIPP